MFIILLGGCGAASSPAAAPQAEGTGAQPAQPAGLAASPSPSPLPSATSTATPMPLPKLNVIILGCDTGNDFLNGLGEVTNAWVTVQNVGEIEASRVEITLGANDEGRAHPDKGKLVQYLPPEHQITLKLTVDTESNIDSAALVTVSSKEGAQEEAQRASCRGLDQNAKDAVALAGELGQLVRIATLRR